MINRIKNNFKILKKCFLGYCATIFPLLEVVTIFIPLEDFGINSRRAKILLFIVLLCIGIAFLLFQFYYGEINKFLEIQVTDALYVMAI